MHKSINECQIIQLLLPKEAAMICQKMSRLYWYCQRSLVIGETSPCHFCSKCKKSLVSPQWNNLLTSACQTTKKQRTKFSNANFKKMLSPSYIILRIHRLEGKQCRPWWEVALHEPPHQDLSCLQIKPFTSLILKELNWTLLATAVPSTLSSVLAHQWQLKVIVKCVDRFLIDTRQATTQVKVTECGQPVLHPYIFS